MDYCVTQRVEGGFVVVRGHVDGREVILDRFPVAKRVEALQVVDVPAAPKAEVRRGFLGRLLGR